MTALLAAVKAVGLTRYIIYPNTDRGHAGIIDAIRAHLREGPPGSVQAVRSLEREDYLTLLLRVDVLVGNSSSGIIEAGAAGTPTVNIGDRQQGRERTGKLVVDAGQTLASIRHALARALRKGAGTTRRSAIRRVGTGQRIAAFLSAIPLSDQFRRK